MIRGIEDLFVGTTAALLGVLLIVCAVTNWQWYYSLRSAGWLTKRLGRGGARIFHALLGLALIALGATIITGFRWTLVGS